HARRRTFGLEVAPNRLLEEDLLLGEPEVHYALRARCWPLMLAPPTRYLRASRGSPSPRSAMMLRWMLAAPPAISTPSDHMYAVPNMPIAGAFGSPGASRARSPMTSIASFAM